MSSFQIDGRLFGKESSTTAAANLRAILPLPAVLQIVDAALSHYLLSRLDSHFLPQPGCWAGARPGTQALDIARSLNLTLEEGMDCKSEAAIAQEDIRTFYDTMRTLWIARWAGDNCMSPPAAACLLRFQMLPRAVLHIGSREVPVLGRCVGGLTGSRVAGAMGRIPVEDTMALRRLHWLKWAYHLDDGTSLMVCTYVDNLFSCSTSVQGAINILEDFEDQLQRRWGLFIKPSSRMVMPCKGSRETSRDSIRWPLASTFPCLGHMRQADAGIRQCYTNVKRQMWKAFWGNCGHRALHNASLDLRCDLLNRCCRPVFSYRCSRWPPQATVAKELDSLQCKMVGVLLRLVRHPGESLPDYCKRRCRAARSHCRRLGTWSAYWFARAKAWDGHLERHHSPTCWPMLLRGVHDNEWLRIRRSLRRPDGHDLRVAPGRPCMRWHEGIAYANAISSG